MLATSNGVKISSGRRRPLEVAARMASSVATPRLELARATQLLPRRNGLAALLGGADRSRSAIGVPRRGSDSHRGAGEWAGSRSPGGQANPEGILDAAAAFAQRDGARASRARLKT
jgi:hypothetical protein